MSVTSKWSLSFRFTYQNDIYISHISHLYILLHAVCDGKKNLAPYPAPKLDDNLSAIHCISGGHLQGPVRCNQFPCIYLNIVPPPVPLNKFLYANLNFSFTIYMLLPYFINNTAILVNLYQHKEFLTISYSCKSILHDQ